MHLELRMQGIGKEGDNLGQIPGTSFQSNPVMRFHVDSCNSSKDMSWVMENEDHPH